MYWKVKDFLAVNDTGDLILQESRIVLPSISRNIAVNLAYAEHLGLTKAKALYDIKSFSQTWKKIPLRY